MKRTIIAAALALVAIYPAAAQDKVRIGTEGAYPPFNYFDTDRNLVGFDIDIAKALCEKMKAECEFVTQDWDGIIPALQANKFDAIIASMSITPERKEVVDFTNKYYNTPPAIAVPKDSELEVTEPKSLDDLPALAEQLGDVVMGSQSSTTHANYAAAHFPNVELRRYGTPEEYKLDLASGRTDAVIDDIVVLSDWLKTPDGACCKLLTPLPVDPVINGEGAGIAIRKGDEALKTKFNEAIDAIRADGTYKTIQDKYFDFDVFGG